jgi:Chloride channel protein EriC
VLNEELPQAPFRIIPVKFIAGVLAIGSGLALGREGPAVQMAATIGHLVGKEFRRGWPDCRVLLAAGAGAGLATAFNAPIAGAIFVLEELVRRFELRVAIAALGASATAISVSRVLLGDAADFHVGALAYADAATRPLYFVLGAVAGLAAIVYNRLLLGTIDYPVNSTGGLSSCVRVLSAQPLGCSLGSRPTLWAVAMRLRSARWSGWTRSPCCPSFS